MSKQKAKAMVRITVDSNTSYTVDVEKIVGINFKKDTNKLAITVENFKTIYTKVVSETNLLKSMQKAKDVMYKEEKESLMCVVDAETLNVII